ncbi:hypothetical protein [Nonomuraea sp. NPDC002799]
MSERTAERTAEVLLEAERSRTDRDPITEEWPGLDLSTAYRAQDALPARKKAAVRFAFAGLGTVSVAGV